MPAPIFIVAISLHVVAIIFFIRKWLKASLLTLFSAAFVLRYYMITIDRFLHEWDERFHALVAKNLMHHWLRPTLFDQPVLPYDYRNWYLTSVWLHKQPLFLWQMALSMKIFGVNEIAIRIPTLVLTSFLVLVIYSIGRMAFNKETGFIAALIFSCYEPILELSSGLGNTDHNDVIFIFYVTLSIYCWLCFEKKKSAKYLWLMGLCSGLAILTKWMTGLVVFAGFGFYHLFMVKDFFNKEIIKQLCISLLICVLTFLPWQLYILYHFPQEARFEYHYNSMHFYEVVEGKNGDGLQWYYFSKLNEQYRRIWILIPVGFAICAVQWRRYKAAIALATISALVYAFFGIAATKMQSFVLMVAPVNILFMAFSAERMLNMVRKYEWAGPVIKFAVLTGLLVLFTDYKNIDYLHIAPYGWTKGYSTPELANMQLFPKIKAQLPADAVVVNFDEWHNVSGMFYTDRTCYPAVSKDQLDILRKKNLPVYFMGDTLPDFARGSGAQLVKDAIASDNH